MGSKEAHRQVQDPIDRQANRFPPFPNAEPCHTIAAIVPWSFHDTYRRIARIQSSSGATDNSRPRVPWPCTSYSTAAASGAGSRFLGHAYPPLQIDRTQDPGFPGSGCSGTQGPARRCMTGLLPSFSLHSQRAQFAAYVVPTCSLHSWLAAHSSFGCPRVVRRIRNHQPTCVNLRSDASPDPLVGERCTPLLRFYGNLQKGQWHATSHYLLSALIQRGRISMRVSTSKQHACQSLGACRAPFPWRHTRRKHHTTCHATCDTRCPWAGKGANW